MNKKSAISRRLESCIPLYMQKDYEGCLVHLFPALDKTAKLRMPKGKVGERIKNFINDQHTIITYVATGNSIGALVVDGVTLPDAIYKFGRNPIAHEGELDPRLQITEDGMMSISDIWILPSTFILGLIISVITAKENTTDTINGDFAVTINGNKFKLNELFGMEDHFRKTQLP